MESVSENAMYSQVTDNIRDNIGVINKLLSDCEVESKIYHEEDKILNFLSMDVNKLFKSEPKSDYYDLDKISNIFEMLDSSKSERKKKKASTTSGSSLSLAALSLHSSEDLSQSPDEINEIKSRLSEIRSLMSSIKNCTIEVPDMNSIQNVQASKTSNFVDLLMKLQKLSKELVSIAASDNMDNHESFKIDDELIHGLDKLIQVRTYQNSLFKLH